jgi:demethylphylloquinone reductase
VADQKRRVLIVGGGFGGVFTALGIADVAEVTLISTEDHFLFTPLLYEYLSGEVEAWHIAPRYRELFDDKVRVIQTEVTDINFETREATLADRSNPIPYDILVLAVGGVTNYAGVEGAKEQTLPFRKIAHADEIRSRLMEVLDHIPPDSAPQDARAQATFAVIGAGASGVELSTKLGDLLNDAFRRRGLSGEPRVLAIEMSNQVVPGMADDIREYVEEALKSSRVEVHTDTRVIRVEPDRLICEHNRELVEFKPSAVIWTGGVRVSPLIERLNLKKERGLVVVEPTMQVLDREEVFVLGDAAYLRDVPATLRGTAQLAHQQAVVVAKNIQALIDKARLQKGEFVELGEALSLGTENAAVLASGSSFSGALARQARFALYTSRLPTWQHRLRVGASWFFEGTAPRPLSLV